MNKFPSTCASVPSRSIPSSPPPWNVLLMKYTVGPGRCPPVVAAVKSMMSLYPLLRPNVLPTNREYPSAGNPQKWTSSPLPIPGRNELVSTSEESVTSMYGSLWFAQPHVVDVDLPPAHRDRIAPRVAVLDVRERDAVVGPAGRRPRRRVGEPQPPQFPGAADGVRVSTIRFAAFPTATSRACCVGESRNVSDAPGSKYTVTPGSIVSVTPAATVSAPGDTVRRRPQRPVRVRCQVRRHRRRRHVPPHVQERARSPCPPRPAPAPAPCSAPAAAPRSRTSTAPRTA